MRVALFSDTYLPQINGVANTLGRLIKYYEEHNIEYILFAPKYDKGNDNSNIERFYSLKFFIYPENRLALPNVFRVTQKLDEFKPDIIHIMTEFSMGVTGLNYGKKIICPQYPTIQLISLNTQNTTI